jgi:UDP-N-acetylmuramyl pentapeptide phosphotransferase/UDP-N-acetylglucosamine-1-phosphate transferase
MARDPGAWQALVLSMPASAALTLAWIGLARRRGIEDAPGYRRLHVTPTPRGGGIAIAVVLVAALLVWPPAAMAQGAAFAAWWGIAAGLACFALVGAVDDLLPVSVRTKFAGQWLAAALLACSIGFAAPGEPSWLAFAALLVGLVYFVNIWNFMDGSNGLVAVQSLLLALALAQWPGQGENLRLFGMVLAGACLGFLPFNFPRARVFLGDTGSHLLGAAVFVLLALSWRQGVLSLPAALILSSAMLADSSLTLLRRALAHRPVWRAHRQHLYQYAVRSGHSHAAVCLVYAAWTLAAIGLAWLGDSSRSSFVMWVSFTLCSVSALVLDSGLRRRWLSPRTRGESSG